MKVGKKLYLMMADGSRERVVITHVHGNTITAKRDNGDTITDTRENWLDNTWAW